MEVKCNNCGKFHEKNKMKFYETKNNAIVAFCKQCAMLIRVQNPKLAALKIILTKQIRVGT